MVVGAGCRDILQSALGHRFALRATADIDLGVAVSNWKAYDDLTVKLPARGHTGIRYSVAGIDTDLMPFGAVEDPTGTVTPADRREPMSVWAFTEVFAAAESLSLPSRTAIRIPTMAGYAALKLAAWLDRSAYGEYKDASDIATVLYWYANSPEVDEYLYETEEGQEVLLAEDLDSWTASAHVLGRHILDVISDSRSCELAGRWPGPGAAHLSRSMTVVNATQWTASLSRRQSLVEAMSRGLGLPGPRPPTSAGP